MNLLLYKVININKHKNVYKNYNHNDKENILF